jgi:hypothetical protein
MAAAIWCRGPRALVSAVLVTACLSAVTVGLLAGAALASPEEGRGARIVRDGGHVVYVQVPANHRADERAGVNAQTETGKAAVANPIDVTGSVMVTFGVLHPILMSYDIGLRHLDFSGLDQLGWPTGYTGHVSVRQDGRILADEAIQGDTMILYPSPGYVAFPAEPTVLTLDIYATSLFGLPLDYKSWPFELMQI